MIYRTLLTLVFLLPAAARMKHEPLKPHESYAHMVKSFKMKDYKRACSHGNQILLKEGKEPYEGDVHYYLGSAFYALCDLELANEHISLFLEKWASTKFFKNAVMVKYKIARKYQNGYRKHVLGYKSLPKLESGYEDALLLFDEVIGLLPREAVAGKAMFHKAQMKIDDARYNEAVQIYESLIGHFAGTDLASRSFLMIAKVRFTQCSNKALSQNYLDLARKNLLDFEVYAPNDKRIVQVRKYLEKMQNLFARDLFHSARYFEKKKNYRAAVIFYQSILKKYPESSYATEITHYIEELKKEYNLDLGVKRG